MSPVVFAIYSKSLACLKYLVEVGAGKAFRETYQYREENWTLNENVVYSNLAIAVLAKLQDLEALNYLLKQSSFVLNTIDLISFLRHAISTRWYQGVKALLAS